MVRTEEFLEVDWIKRWAQYATESVAIESVDQNVTITYFELHQKVGVTASCLQHEYGIEAGDRVAVLSMNRYEYIVLFLRYRN